MSYENLYSNGEDCKELKKILGEEIKRKIEFSWNVYEQIMGGSYYCISSDYYSDYFKDDSKGRVSFYYKFLKDGFLRIGVGNNSSYKKTVGHKLAALSDFYQVLVKRFGEPTLFYTTKKDKDECLNFEWSFKYKEETIEKFKNDTIFYDAKIEDLIIFGEQQEQTNGYKIKDATKKLISKQIELPFELVDLVSKNFEDFIKYKQIESNSLNDEKSTEKQYVLK